MPSGRYIRLVLRQAQARRECEKLRHLALEQKQGPSISTFHVGEHLPSFDQSRLPAVRAIVPRPPARSRSAHQGSGTCVAGGGKENSSVGSVPASISSPSLKPSPSVSASSGSVPCTLISSPSLSPSRSVSGSNGIVLNRLISSPSVSPSSSESASKGVGSVKTLVTVGKAVVVRIHTDAKQVGDPGTFRGVLHPGGELDDGAF